MLGRRVDPDTDQVEVDGVPRRRRARPRPLPAEQAGRGGDHRRRTRRAGPRWSTWCPTSPGCSRSGRLDLDTEGLLLLTNDGDAGPPPDPPVLRGREGVPGRGRGHAVAGRPAPPAGGRRARRRPRPRRPRSRSLDDRTAAHHHPRGPQPPGPAHARGRRPPRRCAWSAPASARWPTGLLGRGSGARSPRTRSGPWSGPWPAAPGDGRTDRPNRPPTPVT